MSQSQQRTNHAQINFLTYTYLGKKENKAQRCAAGRRLLAELPPPAWTHCSRQHPPRPSPPAPQAPPAPVPGGGAPACARAATHWPAPAAARRPGGGGRGCYEDEGVRSGDGVPPAGRRGALDVPAVPAKAAACPSWCYTALSNRPEARKCSLQERRRRLRPHQVAVRLVDEERGRPGLLAPGQGSLQNEKKNQSFKTARRAKQEAKKQGGLGSPGPGMPSRPHWRQCP